MALEASIHVRFELIHEDIILVLLFDFRVLETKAVFKKPCINNKNCFDTSKGLRLH